MAEVSSHAGEQVLGVRRWSAIDSGLLLLLFVGGLFYRLSASRFGLPFLYDPDEIAFVAPAIDIIQTGDWNPGWFGHPGTTTIYLNVVLFEFVHFFRAFLFDVPDLASDYYRYPYAYTYGARSLYSAFAAASILLTYALSRRIGLASVPSLFAAALVAFSDLHITYSALIRTDTLSAFFMLLSLIFCADIVRKGSYQHYIAAGIFAGLSVATKYPLIICCIAIAIAHVVAPGNALHEWKKLAVAALATVLATFLASPFLFLDFGTVLADVSREARTSHGTATGEGFYGNLLWYGGRAQHWFGNVVLFGALIGSFICLSWRNLARLPVAGFFFLFIFFIASLALRWDRWLVPLIPVAAVMCSVTLQTLFWHGRARLANLSIAFGSAIAAVITWQFASAAAGTVATRTASDTRTAATHWITENVQPKSLILVDSGGPQLPRDKFRIGLYGFGRESGEVSFVYRNEYVHVIPRFSDPSRSDVKQILQSGDPDYIVISSSLANRYRDSEKWHKFETLFSAGKVVQEINPGQDANRGPTIWIIKVDRFS